MAKITLTYSATETNAVLAVVRAYGDDIFPGSDQMTDEQLLSCFTRDIDGNYLIVHDVPTAHIEGVCNVAIKHQRTVLKCVSLIKSLQDVIKTLVEDVVRDLAQVFKS